MKRFLCCVGIHKYEKDPHHKELIKSTGIDVLFATVGIQYGRRSCIHCGIIQECYRTGVMSMMFFPSSSSEWYKCNAATKKDIDKLPVM